MFPVATTGNGVDAEDPWMNPPAAAPDDDPANEATTVLFPPNVGVNWLVQLEAEADTGDRLQVPPPENDPPPDWPNVTVPVGAIVVPAPTSVTVAVHVVGEPATTVPGAHDTEVVVARLRIDTVVLPDAGALSTLPGYAAVTVYVSCEDAVNVDVQELTPVLTGLRVQAVKDPVPSPAADRLTEPTGVTCEPPGEPSVTVTVHAVEPFHGNGVGVQVTAAVVGAMRNVITACPAKPVRP